MFASKAYKIMWRTGLLFVILPHLNLGLLSDYKICGDSGCESPMSRVRAIRDHHGKDCRFLSFRRGDTIFVYHKLTGEREDLWAGGIDKQFGYFPKDAVKEEQVHATVERVVETQESDFFCMDEFGRLIDSSHLDSDNNADNNADNDNEKIQNQESETSQTTPYADNTKSETPSKSEDISAEHPVLAQEADGTSAEEDENKIAPEAAASGTHKEAQETPEAADEQGGSASSAWLGSSVTGLLGLTTEEGAVNLAEGVGEDERKETQAEASSFASSLTGWLGFGGETKPGDALKSTEEDKRQSDDSITSTMTGWLGFGGGEKTDHSVEKEQDGEREAEKELEPAEKFRSRRMSLDLEGSQIHEEVKEEMGTLDWLGNGLSNTLGFGLTNQESEHERTAGEEADETIQEEEKQVASGSWFDIGINDILGLRGDKSDDDEKTGSDFKETEEDKTLEQPLDSENVDTSQSQPTLTDEVRTETSDETKMEETPEDQNVSAETETVTETVTDTTEPATADRNKNDFDTSDVSKNILLPEDAVSEVDQNDISPQNKFKKNTQAVGGVSSVLDVFFQTNSEEEEEDNLSHDNKTETKVLDTEKEDTDHQMLKSVENEGDNNQEPAEEEMKAKSDTDQGFLTQSGIKLEPDLSSNSAEESVSAGEEEKTVDEVEEKEEIPHQTDNTEAFPDLFVKDGASGDDHKGERSDDVETDGLQREIYTPQADDSEKEHKEREQESSGDSQPYSSDTTEERNEPVSNENGMLTVHSEEAEARSPDSLAMTDKSTEAETHHGELGQEAEGQVKGSLLEFGSLANTEIVLENAIEEDIRTFSAESTAQTEENLDQNPASAQQNDRDAHMIKETVNETEDDENNLQPFQTETKELDKNTSNESGLRSATGSETGSEEVEETQGELQEEDVKALIKQQGEVEEEKHESEEEEVKPFENQQKVEEYKQGEMEELIEEGKQEEEKRKDEDNQEKEDELKEDEEVRAFEKQQEMGREWQDEVEELKEEKKQEESESLENEKNQEVEEEMKDEENQGKEGEPKKEKEVKPFENQQEVEEETQDQVEELKEEEKQEKTEELENEKKQDAEEETKKEENQGKEEGNLREEEKLEEVMGSKEDEEMENLKKEKEENLQELKVDERGENLKEVEEVNEKEKKTSEEEQVQLSHSEVEVEKSERSESEGYDKDTQGEISLDSVISETSTQTEKMETENQQIGKETTEEEKKGTMEVEEEKDELKEEEVELKEEMANVENERRDQEEEEVLKCLNEPCPQASEDGFVKDRDGNDSANRLSSIDEGETETGKKKPMADTDQILPVKTVVSHTVPSESTERDEDRKQEEENRNNNAEAGEGETKTSESSLAGNEEVKSNDANSISDPNALGVNQIKKSNCKDNDQLCSGESGQNNLPDHIMLSQTAENKEDHLFSSEAKSINPSDDSLLHQEDQTKPEYTDTNGKKTEQIHSDQKIETKEDTDGEERQMNGKHDDVKVSEDADMQKKESDGSTASTEGGTEFSVPSSDPDKDAQHASGSLVPSDDHSEGITKTEGGGAFGLLKNAFHFFSPAPASESAESAESAPSLDSNTGETSEPQESLTPEQEVELTTDSTQVYVQDLHTDSSITLSQQQQQQPSPTPSPSIQTSSPSAVQNIFNPSPQSLKTGSSSQAKTLSRHYKNLLNYMNVDEMTILIDLFGRHKLQFLDYMLGSSDSVTDDPDNDESILSDVERLLHYHKETLVTPGVRLADTPQEDEERNRPLIALQNFEQLLVKVRETFNTGKSDISNTIHQAKVYKDKETATKEESSKVTDSSVGWDYNNPRDQWMGEAQKRSGHPNGGTGKEGVNEDEKRGEKERSEENRESHLHVQAEPSQPQEGVLRQTLDFVHQIAEYSTTHIHEAKDLLILLTVQVVSSLPDDIRPGPDLYGVPWEPVIITSVVGLMTMLLFTCRCYSSVKSRMYRSKERWLAEQVAQMLNEKCKVLETLSECQQEYDELESSLRDNGVLAQTQKTEHLQGRAKELEHAKRELERDIEQLNDQLDQQREHRMEQEGRIAVLEESMKTFEEEIKDLQSQEEQAQTTLKVYNMNSDRLQRNLETAREENTLLQESNAQLRQQLEGWAERVSDIEAEMSRCEVAHRGMLQDVANKDERIMSLTDRLLRMKAWDSELEEEEGEEGGEKETSNGTAGGETENGKGVDTQSHLQKVQKLIYAAKLNADLKSVDEDKDRAFAKLNDEVKAKEDLLEGIKELEKEKLSLHSDTEHFSDQVQRLQQKLNIMTEMYQENELKLHRMLTVEEKERLQKEEKLHKADKNIALALEELDNYRQRAQEMEEELEKTKQSYQTQMSAHEKKAHNNWLAARAADRELTDIRRENALLRQKLTDTQFKLDALDKDPYALNSLARPLPFRGERSPYGPSPLGRPASETRAFLSPPTLMDGPPARLSPRVPRGQMELPGGQGEMERSGGPHSDSGSNSPTWERDRRGPPPGPPGPLGPPGYMFPEPGGPMYRRPLPPPGPLGILPPPGSIPPGPLHIRGLPPGPPPHPADMADVAYRENSLGPGEQEHREQSGSGDRRTPPDTDPRIGGIPPPGPPMGPIDGPFPRRAPYGPPPPDFFPPRGPGGPPMMPMWNHPPPGMMFPPRFPAGGPPLPPVSHHAPPMRPPLPDGLPPPSMGPPPPQQSLPSPPQSQSPEEHKPSPEDAI